MSSCSCNSWVRKREDHSASIPGDMSEYFSNGIIREISTTVCVGGIIWITLLTLCNENSYFDDVSATWLEDKSEVAPKDMT